MESAVAQATSAMERIVQSPRNESVENAIDNSESQASDAEDLLKVSNNLLGNLAGFAELVNDIAEVSYR